jgi:hypothetical protein
MQQRDYPTPHASTAIDAHLRREGVQRARSEAAVSPGLDRPGLDPAPVPEPALHLLAGLWVASCPTCGFQLTSARTQERCERRAARRRCPVCHEDA